MDIGEIYRLTEFIANKERSGGTCKPDDFNILIEGVNNNMFDDVYNKVIVERGGDPAKVIWAQTPLKDFVTKVVDATVAVNKIALSVLTDYFYLIAVNANYDSKYRNVEIISENELLKRQRSVLSRQIEKYPVAVVDDTSIYPYPNNIVTAGTNVTYLKKPTQPVFSYINDSLDHVRFLAASHIKANLIVTGLGAVGQDFTLKVTYGGVDTELIDYTITAADTQQSFTEAIADQVSGSETDYYAEVGANELTIYYNHTAGVFGDYALVEGGTSAGNVTTPGTFSAGTGSINLEWSEIYHFRFIRELLERIGVSLKEQEIQAYAEREKQS